MNEELMDGKDRLLEEIRQLQEVLKGVREERDYLFNKLSNEKLWLQQENTQLKQQLKDKDEKISKIREYCIIEREDINGSKCDDILEILESNKED